MLTNFISLFKNAIKPKALPKGLTSVSFKISGMHCPSCCINIDGVLEDLEGVGEAKTNFAKSVTVIQYNPKIINTEIFKQVISQAGYQVEAVLD